MITKEDILNMARHIARRGEGYADRRIIHPVRDWFTGLSVAVLLFMVSLGGTGYLFLTKSNAVTKERGVMLEPVEYDQRVVAEVLETYQARKEKIDLLRSFALPVVEPVEVTEEEPVAEEGALQVE